MKLTINPEMRRELNKIAGMLNSPDPESVKLGAQLFLTSDTIREFRSMWYSSREGREIPISWYIKKAHKIIEEQTQKKIDDPWEYRGLLLPIIQSIVNGEHKFKAYVTFEFTTEEV